MVLVKDVDFAFGLGKGDEVCSTTRPARRSTRTCTRTPRPSRYGRAARTARMPGPPRPSQRPAPRTTAEPPRSRRDPHQRDRLAAGRLGRVLQPRHVRAGHSGYEIRDNSDDHRWQFLPGTMIAGGAYLVVDEKTVGTSNGAEARSAPLSVSAAPTGSGCTTRGRDDR